MLALLVVYLALGLIKILQHVMWRDEWRAWMVCRDSESLVQLWQNLRFDGHPPLWYAALFLLSRFTRDPVAMKLFHLAVAAGAVWLVVRYSPLMRLQKILFVFGYFAFFEYATISRAYGLGMLLFFAGCALMVHGRRHVLWLGVVLALLAQTSIYGVLLAGSMVVTYAIGRRWQLEPMGGPRRATSSELAAGTFLLLGFILAFVSMLPGPDRSMIDGTWSGTSIIDRGVQTTATIWRAYAPVPRPQIEFWNSNLLDGVPVAQGFLAIGLFAGAVWLMRNRPLALILLLIGSGTILLVTGLKFAGAVRHHGHLFLVLLGAYWLAEATSSQRHQGRTCFMTAILLIQALAGITASVIDFAVPFSASREVARFLENERLSNLPIFGHTDTAVSSVSGCLDRPVYYLVQRDFATFNTQDAARRYPLFYQRMMEKFDIILSKSGSDGVLVLTEPMDLPPERFIFLGEFRRSIVPDERYRVYRARQEAGAKDDGDPDHLRMRPDAAGAR